MNEEDYKAVIASYQQKSFELFNQNIVLETQLNTCKNQIVLLNAEIEALKSLKPKKTSKDNIEEY